MNLVQARPIAKDEFSSLEHLIRAVPNTSDCSLGVMKFGRISQDDQFFLGKSFQNHGVAIPVVYTGIRPKRHEPNIAISPRVGHRSILFGLSIALSIVDEETCLLCGIDKLKTKDERNCHISDLAWSSANFWILVVQKRTVAELRCGVSLSFPRNVDW